MRTLGNILWVICGGALLALLWFLVGLILCVTLVGIPLGVQCFKVGGFVLWPFGREIVGKGTFGSILLNVLWILLFGWELMLATVVVGAVQCLTLIGIPFGIQTFKTARLVLAPFGAQIQRKP